MYLLVNGRRLLTIETNLCQKGVFILFFSNFYSVLFQNESMKNVALQIKARELPMAPFYLKK